LWAGLAAGVLVAASQAFAWAMFAKQPPAGRCPRAVADLCRSCSPPAPRRSAREINANAQCAEARFRRSVAAIGCWKRIARKPALLNFDGETRTVSYLSCAVRDFDKLAASFLDDPQGFHEIDAARHRAVARRSDAPWRHDRPG